MYRPVEMRFILRRINYEVSGTGIVYSNAAKGLTSARDQMFPGSYHISIRNILKSVMGDKGYNACPQTAGIVPNHRALHHVCLRGYGNG